jgi:hypothetical protein
MALDVRGAQENTMKKFVVLAMISMSAAFVGCGDDTGGGTGGGGSQTPNGEVSPQAAQSNTTTAILGSQTAIGGDGLAAAYQLASLGTSALSLVGPAGSQPQSVTGEAKQALQTGVCECTGTSCTFEDCSDDSYAGTFTLNGTLSWANGNVVADLQYAGSDASGQTYDFSVAMDVTVTETSIDGTVSSTGSVNAQGQSVSWESDLVMNDIQFGAAGCPTSGSLDVDASVTYAGSQTYSGQESITFDGTGC